MNRYHGRFATAASMVGALALCAGSAAFAQNTQGGQGTQNTAGPDESTAGRGFEGHHGMLMQQALTLGSLATQQKDRIEDLIEGRRTANVPVQQASAKVLTDLAQQVEQSPKIDESKVASDVSAADGAASAAATVDGETMNQLHNLLTPAQRDMLADQVQAQWKGRGHAEKQASDRGEEHGGIFAKLGLTPSQKAQVIATLRGERSRDAGGPAERGQEHAFMQAFRGDSFDANAYARPFRPGTHELQFAQAVNPVLTPAQRATFASLLRQRAASM